MNFLPYDNLKNDVCAPKYMLLEFEVVQLFGTPCRWHRHSQMKSQTQTQEKFNNQILHYLKVRSLTNDSVTIN